MTTITDLISMYENYADSLQSVTTCNLDIKKSKIHGKGAFARKNIPKNTLITLYPVHCVSIIVDIKDGKELLKFASINDKANDYYNYGDYGVDLDGYRIYGDPKICEPKFLGHMINHSQTPNAVIGRNQQNISLVMSTRDIQKGEELFVNYGDRYWNDKNKL